MNTYEYYGLNVNPNGPEQQYITCPQCSNQRKKKRVKCLSVNTDKECWICHHCGWTGSLEKGGHHSDPHWQKPDYRLPTLLPAKPKQTPSIVQWFITRGISVPTQLRNNVTVSQVYMPQVEGSVRAIGFPYYRGGDHINTKWRDKDKNFRLEAGAELILYGLDDIKDADTVIFVEGEMDKLSVEEAGFTNCVSPPNGAPSPESKNYSSHFDYLQHAEEFLAGKKYILFLDADAPGRHLEEELSRRLGKDCCKRVRLPDGFKDANEYLLEFGAEKLREAIENAQPYPVNGIHEANSLIDGVNQLKAEGLQGGVETGWVALDYFYSVRLGEMTIVTGIPNHGKSNWLDCLTINIARTKGWRFGLFSPENQPLERHAVSLLEKLNLIPFTELTKDEISVGMSVLHDHYFWILPDVDDDWSLDGILEKAKTLVYRHGINGLVIDPWNEIEANRPATMSETEYVSISLTKIRQFARLHNVHVWVVAHPAKLRKDKDSGDYPVPTPYDISGSAHWRNKADNCIAIYRVGLTPYVEVHTQKIRFKEVGRIGVARLEYLPENSTYVEVSSFE